MSTYERLVNSQNFFSPYLTQEDLSRFGREYINAGKYIDRLFPFYGVRLIAINDNIDAVTRDSADDFSITLKNLMNDNYCRDISMKIRSQFQVRRKNGEYLGAFAPYGYMKSQDDHTKLEIDPYAAGVVQDIFRWKIEGMSQAAIAKHLTEQKILAPLEYKRSTGSGLKCSFQKHAKVEWSAVGIGRILSNRVYTGTMIQGVRTRPNYKIKTVVVNPPEKWVVVENAFEAIVSDKTFNLVQRLLKMDTRVSPGKKLYFLLRDCFSVRIAEARWFAEPLLPPQRTNKFVMPAVRIKTAEPVPVIPFWNSSFLMRCLRCCKSTSLS